jgi:hypothetical protein
MVDLYYHETRTDGTANVTPEPKPDYPRFRTCPLCKQAKPETEVRCRIYVDDDLTYACTLCYSVHRDNPYAGLLYG